MARTYCSRTRVGSGGTGWLVAWISNQLTLPEPQWPWLRVIEGQELFIAIDLRGGRFGLKCDSRAEDVRISAVIAPDEQPEDKTLEYLLAFPPFLHQTSPSWRRYT